MLNDLEPYHFESDVFCNEIEKVIPELRDLFNFFNVEKIWKMLRKDIDYHISRHPEDYIFYCEVFKN